MATEAVTPDHNIFEQVEKKVNEEVKAVEQEIISPCKENGGADVEEKSKTEELASPEAPVAESEKKTEDRPVDLPAVVPVEKVDNVPISYVQTVDVQKVIEACNPEPDVSAVPVPTIEAVEKHPEPNVSVVPEPAIEAVEKHPEPDVSAVPVPAIEAVEKLPEPDVSVVPVPAIEAVENEPEEESKSSDAPVAAAVETVDKLVEVPPIPEPEVVPELGFKIVKQPESVAEVEEKAQEQPAVNKKVEEKIELIEPKESLAVETEKDEQPEVIKEVEEKAELIEPKECLVVETEKDGQPEVIKKVEEKTEIIEPKEILEVELAKVEDKSQEDIKLSSEKNCTDQVPVASVCVDAAVATNQEVSSDPKDREVFVTPDVVKTANIDAETVEEVKQPETTKVEDVNDVVAESVSEAALDVVKFEEDTVEKNVKVEEDTEEKNVKVEEVKQPEITKNEVASVSNSATEVTEKSFEGVKASRDVEVVPDEKKEVCVKDNVDTSAETCKDRDVEEKTDVVDTTTTTSGNELVEESKELVLEEKAKDTVELGADKLDKAVEVVEEIAKSDNSNLESSKDVTETKTEPDLPKQEVPSKTTHKQSNNIMSKVKQSIVKVKKAFIGKSPSSKTISTEAKGDLKVK